MKNFDNHFAQSDLFHFHNRKYTNVLYLALEATSYLCHRPRETNILRPDCHDCQEDIPMTMFKRFLKDESGATAIEYGLIASLVAIAIIAVLGTLGTELSTKFQEVVDELKK